MAVKVIAYVTNWCADCTHTLRALQRAGVSFAQVDIENTPGADLAMRALNGNSGKVPTLLLEGSLGREVLIEPTEAELCAALARVDETAGESV